MQIFSERLRALRKERKLKQGDVANLINGNRSTLSGYECEGKEPDMKTICKLAKVFEVSTDYLLGYSDERNHIEMQFVNDTVKFKEHYDNLSDENKELVNKCMLDIYSLLNHDTKENTTERLVIYEEILNVLEHYRDEIRHDTEAVDELNSQKMSDIMFKETEFKNALSLLLDKLMLSDADILLKTNDEN